MRTTLYLARHGETIWNQSKRLQGHLDSPLTCRGIEQASELAQRSQPCGIDFIITSPLGRAASTAEVCQQVLDKPLIIEPALIERNLGDWQGSRTDELALHPSFNEALHQVTELAIANGESAAACGKRMVAGLIALSRQYEQANLLVICHGEALRCLRYTLGERTTDSAFSLHPNGSMTTLSYCHHQQQLTLAEARE